MDDSTLQKKGQWESNINVWFPFKCSQKWTCYFQNRIIMFCLPVPTLIYLWEICIFPGSDCLVCCWEIFGPILGKYKSLTTLECGNWDWGRAIPRKGTHKRDFPCSAVPWEWILEALSTKVALQETGMEEEWISRQRYFLKLGDRGLQFLSYIYTGCIPCCLSCRA